MSQNCFNSESLLMSTRRSVGLAPPLYFAVDEWSSSPYINRFLSADTVVPGYDDPQDLNLYSYVLNNPLRYTDPTGHRPEDGYVGNHGPLNCKKYSEYCSNGKPKSADELAKMRHEKEKKAKEKAEEKKKHDILSRGAEFAFGAALFGVGVVAAVTGGIIVGVAIGEVFGGVITGPGELLVAMHAAAVGSAGIGFALVGVAGIVNGYKTMRHALTP